MTLPNVLAIAGSIALLIGLFGGGIKAKEIEVPVLTRESRTLSILVGIVLIGTAIWLPTFTQQTEPNPTEEPVGQTDNETPSQEPEMEIIPFTSLFNPGSLNDVFSWEQGNSKLNTYNLTSDRYAVTLITDGLTDQWANLDTQPVLFSPISGNFEAQVRIVFSSSRGHEFAGFGVRSSEDHLTWVRMGIGGAPEQLIALDIDTKGSSGKLKTIPYSDNTIYFKIVKRGSSFDFYYGSDGSNWVDIIKGYITNMPGKPEIFLTVGSWGEGGASAEFHDFTILLSQ